MKPSIVRPLFSQNFSRQIRSYAIQAPGAPTLQVFNRKTKILQKNRSARDPERSRQTDYLKDEVAMRLSERLLVWVLSLRCDVFHTYTVDRTSIDIFHMFSISVRIHVI
jgi:hypothetical protein